MSVSLRRLGFGCLALVLLVVPASSGFEPDPEPDDTAARQLLREVVRAYKALPAYSDEGRFRLVLETDGAPKTITTPVGLTFQPPNKIRLDGDVVRLVSDGTKLHTTLVPLKKYIELPAPRSLTVDTLAEGPSGALLFGGFQGPPISVVLQLLCGDDPFDAIVAMGQGGPVLKDDRNRDGSRLRVLRIPADGPDLRLLIDPESKLLAEIELVFDEKDARQVAPGKGSARVRQFAWQAGRISTGTPPADRFRFAGEGLTRIADAEAAPDANRAAEPQFAVQKLVGSDAPDFTLTVLDGAGKTRTVRKADLAKKVVVLDFWATWCGPCLKELPEIQKLLGQYRDRDKVVVVAVSQDNQPDDRDKVRTLVEKTLADQELKLDRPPQGLVAIDPENAVGEAFHVDAYPTLLLLDEKGRVQAVHVGFEPDIRETLGAEIDRLLSGESLVPSR